MDTSRVYKAWLRSIQTENTRKAYDQALQDFFKSAVRNNSDLDQVTPGEIDTWFSDMRERGLSPATITQRLSAVSNFYRYGMAVYGNIITDSPVRILKRPKVELFGKANYLSIEEAKALIGAIDKRRIQGRRDFALFFGYPMLGRRNSEYRKMKWGDIQIKGSKMFYYWSGKGSHNVKSELPPPVYEAIIDMLKADGRYGTIQPEDYLFVAYGRNSSDVIRKNIDSSKPLSIRSVENLLKTYCRKAGLNPSVVKVHSLRHTASMLRKLAGDDLESRSNFLGHRSKRTTEIYDHALDGKCDESWMSVADFLGVGV